MQRVMRLLLPILLLTTITSADTYVVIANKNMNDLSAAQLKAIFLKRLTVIDNINIVPVNLGARDPLRSEFEKKVLKMRFSRLRSYWTKQHYLGHRPPITMQSEESIKTFVHKIEGAIGYINEANLDTRVKILYRWSD